MKKLFCAILAVLFIVPQMYGQLTKVEDYNGIENYLLPSNGLQVLLLPDNSQSNFVVNIVYKVGSRHEGYGESGMAHLLEHMLFKRAKRYEDIKKAIADKGGFANGTTWYDRTNYYEILPADNANLKWALDMESDRMVNSQILQSDLDKEFSVVRNEFEIGENNNSGVLSERVYSTAFLWHNYGKSTIGSKEDIERVKASTLKVFYQKYYQPDNAVLIIAGKFDRDSAKKYIVSYFNSIPKPVRVLEPTYTVEPAQDGERIVYLRRNGDTKYIAAGYHGPSGADKEYAATDALIEMLTSNPSGTLYKDLVETKKASSVSGYEMPLKDPGLMIFSVEIPKDKSAEEAKNALLKSLDGIANYPFTQQDLDRAKNSLSKQMEDLRLKTLDYGVFLTEIVGYGSYKLVDYYLQNLNDLKLADVQAAAKKYFKTSNRTLGYFLPDSAPDRTIIREISEQEMTTVANSIKAKTNTQTEESFEATIENIKKNSNYTQLGNGMKLTVLKKANKGDKVDIGIRFMLGDEQSLTNRMHLAPVLAKLMDAGTKNRTKQQIKDTVDKLKSQIRFGSAENMLSVSVSCFVDKMGATFEVLKDIFENANFPQTELDKTIQELKAEKETNKTDPQNVAFNELARTLAPYTKGHPNYTPTLDEDIALTESIKRDEIVKFYQDFVGASNAIGTAIGKLNAPETNALFDRTFQNVKSKVAFKEIPDQYFESKKETKTIQIGDKTNAAMTGGIELPISERDADAPALEMANELLGGGAFLSSRIPNRLREKEGFSYGAGSVLEMRKLSKVSAMIFYAFYNPNVKDKLSAAFNEEIQKAITSGFTESEFKSSRESYLTQRKTFLGMNNFLIRLINNSIRYSESIEEYTQWNDKISKLNLADVNATTKKYVDPNKLTLFQVGDFLKK